LELSGKRHAPDCDFTTEAQRHREEKEETDFILKLGRKVRSIRLGHVGLPHQGSLSVSVPLWWNLFFLSGGGPSNVFELAVGVEGICAAVAADAGEFVASERRVAVQRRAVDKHRAGAHRGGDAQGAR